MLETKFMETLDALAEEIMEKNVGVQMINGESVKILAHTPNRLKMQRADGKEMIVVLYTSNYCFFEHYNINSPEIVEAYHVAKEDFENEKKAEAAAKEAERVARAAKVSKKKVIRYKASTSYPGFDEEDFMDFIKSEISPTTHGLYSETSAKIYKDEICNILSEGVSLSQLTKDIDQYLFDYTDKAGSMKSENETHHGNPGCALVLFKKYIERS